MKDPFEGRIFGKWEVLKYIEIKKHGRHYECRCTCGNRSIIDKATLNAGRSIQCRPCGSKRGFSPQQLIGERYGKWEVLEWLGLRDRLDWYKIQCECGFQKEKCRYDLRKDRDLECKSCSTIRSKTQHGRHKDPIYKVWSAMLHRCNNPNATYYNHYGGRGISVCERWHKFVCFLEDMGERPDGLTLDRIDNNAGYAPENCRWVTHKENCNNRYY